MPTARAPPCASVSSAEKLTCSAPTTRARRAGRQPLEVDELLKRAGGHHALGTRARHEPRRARAFAAAGGEHHSGGLELLAAPRTGELERPAGRPARDRRLGAQLGARARPRARRSGARSAARTAGAPQVAQTEALMLRMARDAAQRGLALEHEHVGRHRAAAARARPQVRQGRRPRSPAVGRVLIVAPAAMPELGELAPQ